MFVSVVILRGIVAEVRRHGVVASAILSDTDISEEMLSNIRVRVPFAALARVVEAAIALSGDAGLGLSIGEHAPASMLQLLGYLLQSCRTLRDAAGLLQRYSPLLSDGLGYELSESGEVARFNYHCPVPLGLTSRFGAECVLLMTRRISRHFVRDPNIDGLRVQFEHAEPDYLHRYQRCFDCPVSFGQDSNALIFPRRLLDEAQPHADPTVNTALRDLCDRLLLEIDRPRTTAERVEVLLRYEANLAEVDIHKISRELGLTERSLRRRLAAENTSLTTLIDLARLAVASDELRRERPIKEIAEQLGFSEASAFHRAFKRWTGQTPLEYAQRILPQPSRGTV